MCYTESRNVFKELKRIMRFLSVNVKEAAKVTHDINDIWHTRYQGEEYCVIHTHSNEMSSKACDYYFINHGLMNMNSWANVRRNLNGGSSMDIRNKLRSLPGSYDDFVDSTAECMEQEEDVRIAIMEQLRRKPDSTPSDVLKVMCERLGMLDDERNMAVS